MLIVVEELQVKRKQPPVIIPVPHIKASVDRANGARMHAQIGAEGDWSELRPCPGTRHVPQAFSDCNAVTGNESCGVNLQSSAFANMTKAWCACVMAICC